MYFYRRADEDESNHNEKMPFLLTVKFFLTFLIASLIISIGKDDASNEKEDDSILLQEVIERLNRLDVNVALSTLRNYQKAQLIPNAVRVSLGRGKGTATEYPDEAYAEIYAAYMLLNGPIRTTPELLKETRGYATSLLNDSHADYPYDLITNTLCTLWLSYHEKAISGKDCLVAYHEGGIQYIYI